MLALLRLFEERCQKGVSFGALDLASLCVEDCIGGFVRRTQ